MVNLLKSHTQLYNQLLHDALANYELGKLKHLPITPEQYGQDVNQLIGYELFNIIESRLSRKEQFLLNRINKARFQALNTARQGDLFAAEELMKTVRTSWDINQVSSEVNLLYKSFQAAAEAYLDYRRGNFEQAWSNITEAIIIDAMLETEFGYKILFAHRLHLVQNLVRSEARGQRLEKALQLGSQLLSYLQGKSENLPFPVAWDVDTIATLPPEVISITFTLVTTEIALALAGKNHQAVQELWKIIVNRIDLTVDDRPIIAPSAYGWLRMKQALFNDSLSSAIEVLSEFLRAGRGKTPLLWYAAVIDFVAISNELNLPASATVKQQISNDAVHWQDFPKLLLPLLNN
ncbi:hypothetical protein ACQFX9_22570 [Aliinostoc sp. HNIBRCY26]|uniref:hypothetical protein n=1 Tax=Aliinostoc sp. HNIBRCY26 TaxID=3418997 RepID=UPI003D031D24